MNIQGNEYTIGADPEIFVGRNGQFVSAHGLVRGTKDSPFPVEFGAVQVDGMALEFNIDPASNEKEFQHNLLAVREQLGSMIGDLEFLTETSVEFDEEFTKGIPYQNLDLGCEPDFNAYTRRPNEKPNAAILMRTVGGHVHVGGFPHECAESFEQLSIAAKVAQALDDTLGKYSLFWDYDDKRRSMYGQAGCFRPKSYGMEYRTLSNKWIFRPELVKFVFDSVKEAIECMYDKDYVVDPEIKDVINTSNREHSMFNNDPKVSYLKSLCA